MIERQVLYQGVIKEDIFMKVKDLFVMKRAQVNLPGIDQAPPTISDWQADALTIELSRRFFVKKCTDAGPHLPGHERVDSVLVPACGEVHHLLHCLLRYSNRPRGMKGMAEEENKR